MDDDPIEMSQSPKRSAASRMKKAAEIGRSSHPPSSSSALSSSSSSAAAAPAPRMSLEAQLVPVPAAKPTTPAKRILPLSLFSVDAKGNKRQSTLPFYSAAAGASKAASPHMDDDSLFDEMAAGSSEASAA